MKLDKTVTVNHKTYFAGELSVSAEEETQIQAALKAEEAAQRQKERAAIKAGSPPAPADEDQEPPINEDPDQDKPPSPPTAKPPK